MGTNRTRIGIKEVAAAAGVSVTTVSHALNNKGRLPDATRQRVRSIADELGYRPNATARNLVVGRTGLLGLVVSQRGGPPFAVTDYDYFAQLMISASTCAISDGYALVLAPADGTLAPQRIAVDGAIVVDPVRDDPNVSALGSAGIPVVTAGRIPGDDRACWVDNNHIAGTGSILDHLARCGARRIALMTSPFEISYTLDVEQAYRDWCERERMEPLVRAPELGLSERAGYATASELLDLPEPPDAVFATYDRLAYGVLLAAESRGVEVPRQLMVATTATDSQASPQAGTIPLTTLDLHPQEIGRAAASLLVEMLERDPDSRQVIVPHRVIARASTNRRADG